MMLLKSLSLLALTALPSINAWHRETLEEAAVHARELIAYRSYGVGTLMSRYPDDDPMSDLAGLPIGLQEYFAPYPDKEGDILLLGMGIAKIFRNALPPHAPNMTLTISDMYGFGDGNLAAGRMREALFGSLEIVHDEAEVAKCKAAYLGVHPDARGWLPPNGPHFAFYARLRVHKIYSFHGFGNVAWIGWIPHDLYVSSGDKMRSEHDVKKHWPVPEQPEEGEEDAGAVEALFRETEELKARWRVQL